jgi:hypothetical protein
MKSEKVWVVAPNKPDGDHLYWVIQQMSKLGAPSVRAIWDDGQRSWFAAEGSHRLAAAWRFGIVPVIIDITGHGTTVARGGWNGGMTAKELRDWLVFDISAPRYLFPMIRIEAVE